MKVYTGMRVNDTCITEGKAKERNSVLFAAPPCILSLCLSFHLCRPAKKKHITLKSSRSGSINFNFMCAGKPPTLWWVLIVAEGPL